MSDSDPANLEYAKMEPPLPASHAERTELIISNLLRVGVMLSLALLVIGTILSAAHGRYGHTPADTRRLTSDRGEFPFKDPHWLLDGLLHFRGQQLIVFGLVLLILTPTLRVAVSIIAFAVDRDWRFVVITSIVLTLLIVSFFLGGTG